MSETTRNMREFRHSVRGDVVISCGDLQDLRDLTADAIEAVEAQVAEAVARVEKLEMRQGKDGAQVASSGCASVPVAVAPESTASPATPSAVPAPRGFKKGDKVRHRDYPDEVWTVRHSPNVHGLVICDAPRPERWGAELAYHAVDDFLTLVRAADAPEAPAEDAGLVERLARIIVDTPCAANHEGQCIPPGAPVDDCDRANARAVLSDLTAESRLCAPGEVARLKDELAEANGARFLNANAVRLQKARAEAAEETQRLRDAAISVCATSNTRDSAKRHRLDRSNPNWSHGYERVYEAVEREMCHRERAEAAEKERDEARAISAATAERVRNETQSATELRKDLDDAKREASVWKRECEMFSKAWSRELGPRRPKSHLIDELVVGTKDLVAERDALRAELNALRAKPRFRTRKVRAKDAEAFDKEYYKREYAAGYEDYARAMNAVGLRMRVDGAK